MKHKHCYPTLQQDGSIDSNWINIKTSEDVKSICYCTMQELCKAITTMDKTKDKERMISFIHKATKDQINKPF